MKQFLHLTVMLCAILLLNTANAAETEPNDTKAQANTLPLNGNNSGKINSGGDQDWWAVTTNGDGKLDISLTPLSGRYTWVYLYDNDGTTQLNATYSTSTLTLGTDGLAAGTYYIKVVCYYGTDTGSYNISNTLTPPAQANDVEPNATRAQAKVLPLNGNRTGHVGYYYNNTRDTVDWYKVTTTADGKLDLTLTPANGEYVWIYLYDNNGTTLLNSSYSTTTFTQSTDGLAAGTYYIRVNCYYSSRFAPYTLSNTLTLPAQANDTEPNGTKATALTLAPNSATTGHVGYYYNNTRDTADWYKITTTQDGQLKLSLTSANGTYTWIYLYDNDGTTLLNSNYSTTTFNQFTDGLAAGTYYVRINCYYNSQFTPYTFTDTLLTYTNAKDAESNAKPYQAKTLAANTVTPGHIGFYYNNQRDSADWWKINYTGTGALTVTANFEPTKCCGYQYTWMYIYKDTNAAPIYSNYTASPSLAANLTSLTQGYYWIRINTYYSNGFESYTLTPTFTQSAKAKITLVSADTSATCDSTNSLTLKCTKSKAPYTVQLYRYNKPYGSPRTVNNSQNFVFSNLPKGNYYARAFGDGATGTAFGRFPNTELMPEPVNPRTTAIQSAQARLNWNALSCANYFSIQYRKVSDTAWTTVNTNGNTTFRIINGLTSSTAYFWRVAAADSSNGVTGLSAYTDSISFTTVASFASSINNGDADELKTLEKGQLSIYPNPAKTQFTIQYNPSKTTGTVSLWLKNMNGLVVWNRNNIAATAAKGTIADVSTLPAGIYMLHITDHSNNTVAVKKVVVSR